MGLNIGTINETTAGNQTLTDLRLADMDPFAYDASMNGFIPFIFKLQEDGRIPEFLKVVDGRFDDIAWLFKGFTPEYIERTKVRATTGSLVDRANARYLLALMKTLEMDDDTITACITAYRARQAMIEAQCANVDAKTMALLAKHGGAL